MLYCFGKYLVPHSRTRAYLESTMSSTCIIRSMAVVAMSFLFWTDLTFAQTVYRCKDNKGGVTFRDSPCQGHAREEVMDIQPNILNRSGDRERQLELENKLLKQQLQNQATTQPQQSQTQQAPQRTPADLQAQQIDTIKCERARRDYEVTASSTANSPQIIEAKRSMMYGACGMSEPNRTDIRIRNSVNVFR